MSLLLNLAKQEQWQEFYNYKKEKAHLNKRDDITLLNFITKEEYLPLAKKIISNGFCFEVPTKKLINKTSTSKKRTVYFFKPNESMILKLLTFLLYKYDSYFSPNCYSFRKNIGVKHAVSGLIRNREIDDYYCYKLDIKNYFNSIDVDLLLPKLKEVFFDDDMLYNFFYDMLKKDECIFLDEKLKEKCGAMAGTPTSPFLSNVFLTELDRYFLNINVPYARYSDDIIIFAKSEDELNTHKEYISNFLKSHNLEINSKKEKQLKPREAWSFLGVQYCNGLVDLSPATTQKIKDKIRRKARSIYRWKNKNNVTSEKAISVMTRCFNRKFFESRDPNDLTWSRWFFPLLNTDSGLREVDNYLQEYLRYLFTGKHNKTNYKNAPYELLKACGYKSLVNKFYSYHDEFLKNK